MTVKYLKKRMAENEADVNMRERNTDKKTDSMDERKKKENNNNTETNEENMRKKANKHHNKAMKVCSVQFHTQPRQRTISTTIKP